MLWLLKILAFGHVHKWKEVSRVDLHQTQHNGFVNTGKRIYTVCEKCGAHKKWDLA